MQLLHVFNHTDNKEQLPDLSPIQIKKLRHLTIVSMATKNKAGILQIAVLMQMGMKYCTKSVE